MAHDHHLSSPRRSVAATMWSSDVKKYSTQDKLSTKDHFCGYGLCSIQAWPGVSGCGRVVVVNTWRSKGCNSLLMAIEIIKHRRCTFNLAEVVTWLATSNHKCTPEYYQSSSLTFVSSNVSFLYLHQNGCEWFPNIHSRKSQQSSELSLHFCTTIFMQSVHVQCILPPLKHTLFTLKFDVHIYPPWFYSKTCFGSSSHKRYECRTQQHEKGNVNLQRVLTYLTSTQRKKKDRQKERLRFCFSVKAIS